MSFTIICTIWSRRQDTEQASYCQIINIFRLIRLIGYFFIRVQRFILSWPTSCPQQLLQVQRRLLMRSLCYNYKSPSCWEIVARFLSTTNGNCLKSAFPTKCSQWRNARARYSAGGRNHAEKTAIFSCFTVNGYRSCQTVLASSYTLLAVYGLPNC